MRALLLENIHPEAERLLGERGIEVRTVKGALDADELVSALDGVQLLGIRSKTTVTDEVLERAPGLLAVGAFCIGTNQIDLTSASARGLAVFNAPYSNTRSVVELAIAEIISMARHLTDKNAKMRPRSLFLNLCRGVVVDHEALRDHLLSGHLAGAAVDVFPEEPKTVGDPFTSCLQGIPNVILTPHIGGSTQEAQEDIGRFVAGKLRDYVAAGNTSMSVNLPAVATDRGDRTRILHVHHNVPGVLATVNGVLADSRVNIEGQTLSTRGELGYVITDVAGPLAEEALAKLRDLPETVRLRVIAG